MSNHYFRRALPDETNDIFSVKHEKKEYPNTMPSKLPPLNALKVFDVAARKLSFSKAAEELCVTQGAVSKQIKLLEDYLQIALFKRTSSGLELTEAGMQYLPTVMSALQEIQSSTANLQQSVHQPTSFTVSITPSIGSLWLISRLASLPESLSNLRINMVFDGGSHQHETKEADIRIRCLPLSLTHQDSDLLLEETLIPVIHPELLQQQPIESAFDLIKLPLITHLTRPQLWTQFLEFFLPSEQLPKKVMFHHGFEHFFMSLEAAKQKQGVALIPNFLVTDSLKRKEVVSIPNMQYKSGYGFYLSISKYSKQSPQADMFVNWLKEAVALSVNEMSVNGQPVDELSV